ncbi:MAG: mucoidy inhibitor MuiA family protein [Desulfosalsimonadaceae bacterium]
MKHFSALSLLLVLLAAMPLHARETVSSKVSAVTLYADQAFVEREAELEVGAGLHEIRLPLEAFSIDAQSVSAKVFGEGTFVSVQVIRFPLPEPPQKQIRELEEEIEKLQQQKRELLDRKEAASRQEAFLDSVAEFADSQIPKELATQMLDPQEVGATFQMLGERFGEVFRKKTQISQQISKTNEEIRLARRRLDNLRQPGESEQKAIEVVFDSAKTQQIRIAADYVVQNASWSPFYRAVVEKDTAGMELVMNARIRQTTGEDWSDVRLSISNAVPLKGVHLPSLRPWWIDLPRQRGGKKASDSSVRREAARQLASMPKEKAVHEAADHAAAEKRKSAIAFEYEFSRPVSVASRKKDTLLPVYSKALEGEFYYYCVPRINRRAYFVCAAQPDQEMLAGPVHVYFAGHYTGKTFFDPESGGKKFRFALGADRGVRVKREKVADHVKETYFGKFERDMVIRKLGYRISVENRKDEAIRIRVLDQVPVAKTDKIEVDDLSFDPAPAEKSYKDRPGVMMWEMEIGSRQSKTVDMEFTVAYPKDRPPAGM